MTEPEDWDGFMVRAGFPCSRCRISRGLIEYDGKVWCKACFDTLSFADVFKDDTPREGGDSLEDFFFFGPSFFLMGAGVLVVGGALVGAGLVWWLRR